MSPALLRNSENANRVFRLFSMRLKGKELGACSETLSCIIIYCPSVGNWSGAVVWKDLGNN